MSTSTESLMKKIIESVEELKSILIILNHDTLEKQKEKLLPNNSIKKKIYDLCDGSTSISDIATTIGKDTGYVGSNLTRLKRDGLIRKIEVDSNIFYEQIF